MPKEKAQRKIQLHAPIHSKKTPSTRPRHTRLNSNGTKLNSKELLIINEHSAACVQQRCYQNPSDLLLRGGGTKDSISAQRRNIRLATAHLGPWCRPRLSLSRAFLQSRENTRLRTRNRNGKKPELEPTLLPARPAQEQQRKSSSELTASPWSHGSCPTQ